MLTMAHLTNSPTESKWTRRKKNLSPSISAEGSTKDRREGVGTLGKRFVVMSPLKDDVIHTKNQTMHTTQRAKVSRRLQTSRNRVCALSHTQNIQRSREQFFELVKVPVTLQEITEVHVTFTLLLQKLFIFHSWIIRGMRCVADVP